MWEECDRFDLAHDKDKLPAVIKTVLSFGVNNVRGISWLATGVSRRQSYRCRLSRKSDGSQGRTGSEGLKSVPATGNQPTISRSSQLSVCQLAAVSTEPTGTFRSLTYLMG